MIQGKKRGEKNEFSKTLSLTQLVRVCKVTFHKVLFGIGNTIGAGVFALTGVAAQYAGK